MDRAESQSKLPTPLCEVEDYCSSESSSPTLKQAFQLKTEAKSFKTVVMPVMTIATNNLKEGMATIKPVLERLIKESEEKEAHIKL